MSFDDPIASFHNRLLGKPAVIERRCLDPWVGLSFTRYNGAIEIYVKRPGVPLQHVARTLELPLDTDNETVRQRVITASNYAENFDLNKAFVSRLKPKVHERMSTTTVVVWAPRDADWSAHVLPTVLPIWMSLAAEWLLVEDDHIEYVGVFPGRIRKYHADSPVYEALMGRLL